MHLSSHTLFVIPLLALLASAAPGADRGLGIDLVVETAVDLASHRSVQRSGGGGGGGDVDWKRVTDNSPPLL
ncbi:hypothetical protein EI94DRAFT_1717106 [Lactarius quietus]|nr:hypothetical protein EI94DRAFT_1717106 [Lactarius quietus]